jgi:hypothetical protein
MSCFLSDKPKLFSFFSSHSLSPPSLSLRLRQNNRPYGYRGLKIFTSLKLRFQDFQRKKTRRKEKSKPISIKFLKISPFMADPLLGRDEVTRTNRGAEGIGGRVKFLPLAWAGMPKTSFRKNSDSPRFGSNNKTTGPTAIAD